MILEKEVADFWGILVSGRDSHWGLYATPFCYFWPEAASAWATDYSLWSVFVPCLVFHLQLTVVLVDEDFSELNLALMDQC